MGGRVKRARLKFFAAVGFLTVAQTAFATTTFSPGDFGYVFFEYGINNILHGPIGFTIGAGFIVFAAKWALEGLVQRIREVAANILIGVLFLKADTVVSTISGTLF